MSIFKKRREEGFNLAFLDVMACGLGAVILILILVKFSANTDIPIEELERLQQELAAMEDKQSELQQSLSSEQEAFAQQSATLEDIQQRLRQLQIEQDAVTQALKEEIAVVADLEDAIAAAGPLIADDSVTIEGAGEEQYLIGLKVEGQRIGILLDMSASMTEEQLIEVIKRKVGTDQDKRAGSKWQRTLRILNWLLARLPNNAQVSVVAFNDTSAVLGKRVNNQQNTDDINQIAIEASGLVPTEGTNLQQGLQTIAQTMPNISDLYLITDGLPTYVNAGSGFNETRACRPIKGKQATITGECRVNAFAHTLRANPLSGVRTHVILLPLEGDPTAASLYWSWSDGTLGTFIAPAGTWP
ncbi:VWA domain-containing protein [Glaciecola sp. XM2]|uniref:VWA domain-containing protein n=1 Tax=Glaciecola sp. XM2 TaxID=1914931 RepID=UPI0020324410|nr:VWA domain-containing protein [Glaciecola sp. XM2]